MSGFEAPGDDTGASVSVIAVDAGPGAGPPLHRHAYEEVFVVLDGEATFTLGDAQRSEAGYRLGSDRGRPNHGSTLLSKRVKA
jgi:hypothetical protein